MNTPTPRTDAAWAQTFDANAFLSGRGNAANQMRDECATFERELTALTAEVKRLLKQVKDDNRSYGCELRDPYGTIWEQATKDHARAERAEAAETVALAHWNKELERAMKAEAERDHLHDQLRALTLICGTNDANKFETWIDRANARAEEAEANLAVERARLDWLETPSGMDWQWEPERLTVSRASIDAAMKEDAK